MEDRVRETLQELGLLVPARRLTKRVRLLKRLLNPKSSFPLHRNENITPFFIVGSGRCGTTLLRRLLQASHEVHIPPENWSLGGLIVTFRQYRWVLDWQSMVDLLLGQHLMESHRWFKEPPRALRSHIQRIPDEKRSLASLIDKIYRYHGNHQKAEFERWGDKTPMNVWHMNAILETLPNAKFIHLIRDGIDVIHSYLERDGGQVVKPSLRWKRAVTAAREFANKHPNQLLEIRYETLCRAPEKELDRICQFLDIRYRNEMISSTDHYDEMEKSQSVPHYENIFEDISTDSIGKGRKNLSKTQKIKAKKRIEKKLKNLGYEKVKIES